MQTKKLAEYAIKSIRNPGTAFYEVYENNECIGYFADYTGEWVWYSGEFLSIKWQWMPNIFVRWVFERKMPDCVITILLLK